MSAADADSRAGNWLMSASCTCFLISALTPVAASVAATSKVRSTQIFCSVVRLSGASHEDEQPVKDSGAEVRFRRSWCSTSRAILRSRRPRCSRRGTRLAHSVRGVCSSATRPAYRTKRSGLGKQRVDVGHGRKARLVGPQAKADERFRGPPLHYADRCLCSPAAATALASFDCCRPATNTTAARTPASRSLINA